MVVFNNRALGFVEPKQKSYGVIATGTDFKNPNFTTITEAVGGHGIRLEDPSEVDESIAAAPHTSLAFMFWVGNFHLPADADLHCRQLQRLSREG
jgi:thiamine pyrophosphate-dependent acetolactate synthase large subunit-like protein